MSMNVERRAEGFLDSVGQGDPGMSGAVAELRAAVAELGTEHRKLEQSWTSLITLEEKKMVFKALGLMGRGFQGRGHWYSCRGCGMNYAVLSTPFASSLIMVISLVSICRKENQSIT
jgi:hypothetical protein